MCGLTVLLFDSSTFKPLGVKNNNNRAIKTLQENVTELSCKKCPFSAASKVTRGTVTSSFNYLLLAVFCVKSSRMSLWRTRSHNFFCGDVRASPPCSCHSRAVLTRLPRCPLLVAIQLCSLALPPPPPARDVSCPYDSGELRGEREGR